MIKRYWHDKRTPSFGAATTAPASTNGTGSNTLSNQRRIRGAMPGRRPSSSDDMLRKRAHRRAGHCRLDVIRSDRFPAAVCAQLSRCEQFLFLSAGQALHAIFETQRLTLRFATPDGAHRERASTASVSRSSPSFVGRHPRGHVTGDAGVDRSVGTSHQVEEPRFHGGRHGSQITEPRENVQKAFATRLIVHTPPLAMPSLRLPLGADAVKSIREELARVSVDVDPTERIAIDTAF
jgi:hypothetical protein